MAEESWIVECMAEWNLGSLDDLLKEFVLRLWRAWLWYRAYIFAWVEGNDTRINLVVPTWKQRHLTRNLPTSGPCELQKAHHDDLLSQEKRQIRWAYPQACQKARPLTKSQSATNPRPENNRTPLKTKQYSLTWKDQKDVSWLNHTKSFSLRIKRKSCQLAGRYRTTLWKAK